MRAARRAGLVVTDDLEEIAMRRWSNRLGVELLTPRAASSVMLREAKHLKFSIPDDARRSSKIFFAAFKMTTLLNVLTPSMPQ